ncbi:MAG TPA: VIT domain-containing protein [Kineosporiaceae bacterium]
MTQPAPPRPLPESPVALATLTPAERDRSAADPEAGFGCLSTAAGNLPLVSLDVDARITGLVSRVVLTQRYLNAHREPLEATYVFPLPDRGAVTGMRLTAAGRTVVARLRERGQARAEYDAAVVAGRRASIAEEERPDVFTVRVGNILAGEQVTVELTLVGVLPVVDGEATFRFPLVVAPRYVPGAPLPGDAVGAGYQPDTDAVPDASRISPPVLLPGFPQPVRLGIAVTIDPAGLPMGTPRSSLHAVQVEPGRVVFRPGERPDRDVVLRIPLEVGGEPAAVMTLVPDAVPAPDAVRCAGAAPAPTDPYRAEGTFELVIVPPEPATAPPPRDVVLLLDRSGSMAGWKVVAARRAAARIIDTLTDRDRFATLAFDTVIETPAGNAAALLPATDRNRFRAVEFLARLDARGGTELAEPLRLALSLLQPGGAERPAGDVGPDRRGERSLVLVLVTDGQVGNEDQILRLHAAGLGAVRVHTVGIDQAVNAGFLARLAGWGRGRCELVESEDRLDEAMARIHQRIGSPVVLAPTIEASGVTLVPGTYPEGHLPDVFPQVPWVVRGRYRAAGTARATVRGTTAGGDAWSVTAQACAAAAPAVTATWARGHVRDLEDRYVARAGGWAVSEPTDPSALEQRIVQTSLAFGVLCRFTAFVAVDERVVTEGGVPRTVVQPVEYPAGWAGPTAPPTAVALSAGFADFADGSAPRHPAVGSGPVRRPTVFAAMTEQAAEQEADSLVRAGAHSTMARDPVDARSSRADDSLEALLIRDLGRLRELSAEPVIRRREALADLTTWLAAVSRPADLPEAAWRRLTAALDAVRAGSEPFDDVWREVLDSLAALVEAPADADPSPDHGQPPGPEAPEDRGGSFWRRHPLA